jgi:hypothetical protein
MRAAISAVAVTRHRSLNHRICSSLAPGMKRDVNQLPIDRVVLSPPRARQRDPRSRRLLGLTIALLGSALRIDAVEDEVRNPLWMSDRVANRRGAALRDTEEHERRPRLRRLDHRHEILGRAVDRQLRDVSLAHAATALVIADEAVVLREETNPVAPDRAFGVVLEVGEPIRRFDERWSGARLGPGDRRAVGGLGQAYRLAHLMACGRLSRRQSTRDRDKAHRRSGMSAAKTGRSPHTATRPRRRA